MPIIRPVSDLRNHADKISRMCRKWHEPVFITKNGREDLVVMSPAYYEQEFGMNELVRKLDEAESSLKRHPKGISHNKVIKDLRARLRR